MRRNQLVLLLATVLVVCFGDFVAGSTPTKRDENNQLSNDSGRRYLKGAQSAGNADTARLDASDEERAINFDASKFKSLSKSMPNLEKLKSMTGLQRQKSLSNTMSKLLKMQKSRSVSEAELTKMRKFANQDPDLVRIKPLVGTNPTKVSAEQLKTVQSYLKKHPKEGPNVVEWMVGGTFLFFALFSAGMLVKELAS